MIASHPARWWRRLDDVRIQCDLCPRRCRLKEGQRAFCFVRQRVGDGMVLTTYGRSTGFATDPVEKKPLNHFLPGTTVYSFGTAGCNLGCRFCQNWSISKSREMDTLAAAASPEQIADTAVARGCASVAYTYNDPVIFAEFAIDTARACHERGLANVAVTAGFITREARPEFFAPMDAVNVDLKAFDDDFYRSVCQSVPGGLDDVLETLLWLRYETDVWIEITTLLIPGLNDTDEALRAECGWIQRELGPDVPVHFTAFHPDFKMRDRPPTRPETLARARLIALESGLRYAYTGNVYDPRGQSTYCPRCGAAVIRRVGHCVSENLVRRDGTCGACGARIAGVFELGVLGSSALEIRD